MTTNKPVTDSDPTQIIVSILDPRINVIKRDANTEDIDGNVGGNDSQTVTQGSGAVFQIIVANTGEEDLKNITLSDALAAACSSKPGTVVDLARLDPGFTNTENSTVRITISGAGNHRDDIFQVGEKFTYTCSKPNTQANYTNIIDVAGVGVTSGKNVTDSDPTEVLLSQEPAIQVIKSDANSNDLDGIQFNDTQTVVQGTSAIFHITVKNSGFEGLKDIQLTDTLAPACGTL